ncbi:MAG: hypothetical protein ACJAWV_002676 [Flammeovirgaceae bacterium]|jgi:hypothetical protein
MKIAIIAEGRDDQAVITNILKGVLAIESANIICLRPELASDETDLSGKNTTLGGMSRVINECKEKERLDMFLAFADQEKIVIHLDTAEAHEFGVVKPTKPSGIPELKEYSLQLRNLVIEKVREWTDGEFEGDLLHAIAVEETEAWLLPLFKEYKESAKSANPKEKMKREAGQPFSFEYNSFLKLSKDLSKPKTLEKACKGNQSLKLFVEECKVMVINE